MGKQWLQKFALPMGAGVDTGGSRRVGGCESTTAICKNGEPALQTMLTKLN